MATKSIVDELFIRLSVDDNTAKGINKALGNLNKLNTAASQKTKKSFATMASNVSKSMDKVSKSISRVGKSMFRSLTLPLLATALAAIKLGTDFTASMNRVRATTQATAEEFERLESTAKRLGATTPKSARDIAKGMATLGLAGFEAVDVLNAIPQVTNLSIISFQNMEKSAQDAADLMSQFNIEAKDLGRAVDVLAVAATNSNTTVDQMIQGFKFAGPIASQLGISLEATAAVMGTLANSGIRAGIAGRALRMGLLNLSAPSSKAAKEMKNLGFSAFDTEGKFKTVDIILEDLNKSMDGYSAASKNVALRNIFGARAIGPFTKLLDQQAKTVTITQEMYGEMGNSLDALQLDVGDTISSFKLFELQMENSQGRGEEWYMVD